MTKQRLWQLDALRGLALLNMLAYHAMYDWVYVFGHAGSWYNIGAPGCHVWQQYICWSFILLSGYSFTLARRPLKPLYSFGNTNAALDYAYLCFDRVKQLTARLASIDNSVYRLAVAIKKTQRRANMLENVNIPKFEENIRFISGVLEEREREEFTRLKVIKRTKGKS